MDMLSYIEKYPDQLPEVARKALTKPVYLRQIARGHRKAGHKLAHRLEAATNTLVTVHDLRPDIFGPPPDTAPTQGTCPDVRNEASVTEVEQEAA